MFKLETKKLLGPISYALVNLLKKYINFGPLEEHWVFLIKTSLHTQKSVNIIIIIIILSLVIVK